MANNKTDILEQIMLSVFLQQGSWSGGSLELSLYTTLPDEQGNNGVEVTGQNYARVQIIFDVGPNLDGNSDYYVTHGSLISFGVALDDWGTIVGLGISDTSNGITLYYGDLATPQTVLTNDQVVFVASSIVVTEK